MTLAVMTRATLGHTGRALVASKAVQMIYSLVLVATVARVCAALEPQLGAPWLHLAALAWASAFLGFALAYWQVLTAPRVSADRFGD